MLVLKPGVYIGLAEQFYFEVDALGSSDLSELKSNPADWWYGSRHNPDREQKDDAQARRLGRALHALMLEGVRAYERSVSVEPDPRHYPDVLKTADEIRYLLIDNMIRFPSKPSKQDLVDAAVKAGYGKKIWDHIIADHLRKVAAGRVPLTAAQDRALRHMAKLADSEPSIGPALRNGIPEVTVFWRRPSMPEILFRARLDSLAPVATIDLKTLSNWKGRTIADMARRQIEEFEYDIQRRFYDEARAYARAFIDAGEVMVFDENLKYGQFYGADVLSRRERKILKDVAKNDSWRWIWLFYQLRDDRNHKAPIIIPRSHEPSGEVWDEAGRKIDRAIENYQDYVKRFGFDTPWAHIEPARELDDTDLAGLRFKTAV